MNDRRTQTANLIARALLDYAHPAHVPFHERYAAAEAALAHIDKHLAAPLARGGIVDPGAFTTVGEEVEHFRAFPQAFLDKLEAVVDERERRLDVAEARFAEIRTNIEASRQRPEARPGWLARARQWLLGDHPA